jgi:hypothetical protein
MDIRTSVTTQAFINDAGAVRNGLLNANMTAARTSDAETTPKVTSIQEETSNIKNTNDVFGFLKKSEKSLNTIAGALASGTDLATVKASIAEILDTTTYKEQNLFEQFRQPGGSAINLRSTIETALEKDDKEGLEVIVAEQQTITAGLLADVKKELLGSSNSLDRRISTDIDTIKRDIESMSPLADVNSADQLKSKLKALLG